MQVKADASKRHARGFSSSPSFTPSRASHAASTAFWISGSFAGGIALPGVSVNARAFHTEPVKRCDQSLAGAPENGLVLSQISRIIKRYFAAAFDLPRQEMTTAEFCREMARRGQAGPGPEIAEKAAAGSQANRYVPDTTRVREELGVSQTVGLWDALRRTGSGELSNASSRLPLMHRCKLAFPVPARPEESNSPARLAESRMRGQPARPVREGGMEKRAGSNPGTALHADPTGCAGRRAWRSRRSRG